MVMALNLAKGSCQIGSDTATFSGLAMVSNYSRDIFRLSSCRNAASGNRLLRVDSTSYRYSDLLSMGREDQFRFSNSDSTQEAFDWDSIDRKDCMLNLTDRFH